MNSGNEIPKFILNLGNSIDHVCKLIADLPDRKHSFTHIDITCHPSIHSELRMACLQMALHFLVAVFVSPIHFLVAVFDTNLHFSVAV